MDCVLLSISNVTQGLFFYFQVLCVSFSMRARWDSGSATPKDLMRHTQRPDVKNPAFYTDVMWWTL